jgi:hypothetical protein
VAQEQHAKSWELRASTSLARLWQQQGKRAEAHQMLSEIYHWFTERFDMKDLQEARGLLKDSNREICYSFCKSSSAVMTQERLTQCFTSDHNFEQAGFVKLL